jgi:hypothetical protein
MIGIGVIVANFVLVFSSGFAYGDVVLDGRFSKGDFSAYRALEANGGTFHGALVPRGIPARLEQVADPAGSGKVVMRATHVYGDVPTNGGYRSELNAFQDPVGSERWYSWGYYLPETFKATKNDVIIAQIHDTADVDESNSRNPTLAVLVQDDKVKLLNVFDYDRITSPSGTAPIAGVDYERRELTSWNLDTGKWTFLDLHVKWAADDTGFLEFWKDGVLLFQEQNHINTFNDERGVWFKSGLYDWSANPMPVSAYYTGVLIGDGKETFQSMSMSLVPEPNVYLLMLTGLAGIGFFAYARQAHPPVARGEINT